MSKTLLVIPHYHDAERIGPFLRNLLETLPPHFSILVSDDGSPQVQRTMLREVIRELLGQRTTGQPEILSPIFVSENTGKGGAVRRGWDYGVTLNFDLLAFADSDGAVSAAEIARSEAWLRKRIESEDALFASRIKMLGKSVKRSLRRHLAGRVFATLVSTLGKVPAYDTQCGLKILKTEAYRSIRPELKINGFAFDVELCLLLIAWGWKVEEFPISWHDVPGSKVRLVRDSIRMAVDVIKTSKRIALLRPNH